MTSYHPQTDGLIERLNQALMAMLKKAAGDEGKDWDKVNPYLLFAYREAPQSSTGFSPFELLYGRSVRAPLDVLHDAWELCQVGEHQHRLAHQCSCEKISTHMKCEVKHNGDVGMGQLWLIMGGAFMAYNAWGSYDFRVWLWLKWMG